MRAYFALLSTLMVLFLFAIPSEASQQCCCYRIVSFSWIGLNVCDVDCTEADPPELCEVEKYCWGTNVNGKCKSHSGSCGIGNWTPTNCGSTGQYGSYTCTLTPTNPNDPACFDTEEELRLCIEVNCLPDPNPTSYTCPLGGTCCHANGNCK
ncbi:MAG: hypothetical protein GEEBNDBF_01329 [bacterium]|nr:hypothetical protein [bacterium]